MNTTYFTIAALIAAGFMFLRLQGFGSGISSISSKDAKALKNDQGADVVFLDVRTTREVQQGKIKNSKNIDVMSSDFKQKVDRLDKSKTYVVYCRSGQRSMRAAKQMKALGFEKIFNLSGGFMRWSN